MVKEETLVSSSEYILETRMRTIIDLYESRKYAALAAGVSTDMLARYMRGDSQPSFKVVAKLCAGVGVSVSWAATGEGEMLVANLTEQLRIREDASRAIMGDSAAQARREDRHKQSKIDIQAAVEVVKSGMNSVNVTLDNHWVSMIAGWVNAYGIEEQDIADLGSLLHSQAELANEFALVPGYSVEVAAGAGAFPNNEQPTRKLAFRHKWLRYRGLKPDDLVLVFAKGDSMEPTISDNNTLMIDTSQQELTDGSIYVIRTDGHLIVKRIQKLWNKGILLISDNKEYREQQIEPNEADDLEVIGKVVWIGKDV